MWVHHLQVRRQTSLKGCLSKQGEPPALPSSPVVLMVAVGRLTDLGSTCLRSTTQCSTWQRQLGRNWASLLSLQGSSCWAPVGTLAWNRPVCIAFCLPAVTAGVTNPWWSQGHRMIWTLSEGVFSFCFVLRDPVSAESCGSPPPQLLKNTGL